MFVGSKGYNYLYFPSHKNSDKNGYIRNSIYIARLILGNKYRDTVVIHHIDENRSNDKNSNLVLCENKAYHNLLHRRTRALKESGNVNYRKCWYCKQYDDPLKMYIKKNGEGSIHYTCQRTYLRNWRKSKRKRGDAL